MGKQLERFVKAVVGDILKWDYPYPVSYTHLDVYKRQPPHWRS